MRSERTKSHFSTFGLFNFYFFFLLAALICTRFHFTDLPKRYLNHRKKTHGLSKSNIYNKIFAGVLKAYQKATFSVVILFAFRNVQQNVTFPIEVFATPNLPVNLYSLWYQFKFLSFGTLLVLAGDGSCVILILGPYLHMKLAFCMGGT